MTNVQTPDNPDAFIVGALVAVLMMLAAGLIYLVKTFKAAQGANSAVNNVGPGEHRLYDKIGFLQKGMEHLIEANDQFNRKGWNSLPQDINTASGLTEVIRELQNDHRSGHELLERIEIELLRHIKWEESQKYKDGNGNV